MSLIVKQDTLRKSVVYIGTNTWNGTFIEIEQMSLLIEKLQVLQKELSDEPTRTIRRSL